MTDGLGITFTKGSRGWILTFTHTLMASWDFCGLADGLWPYLWGSSIGGALLLKYLTYCKWVMLSTLVHSHGGLSFTASPRLPFITFSICDFNGQNFGRTGAPQFDDLKIPCQLFANDMVSAGFVSPWPPLYIDFGWQPSVKWLGWGLAPPSLRPVFSVRKGWIVPYRLEEDFKHLRVLLTSLKLRFMQQLLCCNFFLALKQLPSPMVISFGVANEGIRSLHHLLH